MNRVIRKTMILRAALTVGLVTILGGGAIAVAVAVPHATRSTAHGEGFQLKPLVNTNDCIDVVPGGTQGRLLSLSLCSQVATQRWTFTKNSDGSNLFVDSQGMCVDSVGRKANDGIALKVMNCSFVKTQRVRYSSVGRIQVSGSTNCLSVPAGHVAAPIFLTTCNNSSQSQQFKLSL